MMAKFTRALRQQIVRDFAIRHNGHFNPQLFLKEVRATGPDHPAYEWFEWNDADAAHAYRVEQARAFARDLRVTFTIEEVGRGRSITVRQVTMPMVVSPIEGRKDGGGYLLSDPDDSSHMAEHCRQAAVALTAWIERYQAAVFSAGISLSSIEGAVKKLEAAGAKEAPEAA